MKRKTAKDILAESFRELAEKKKVDKITVRDIAENCGYSTTTFYRHFKDKYDLIAWDHTRYVSQIMDRVGKDGYSWNQTLYEGMSVSDAVSARRSAPRTTSRSVIRCVLRIGARFATPACTTVLRTPSI